MRQGTLTVKLKFKVMPEGMQGQSVAGEPAFPASIIKGEAFEVDVSPICDTRKAEVKYGLVSDSLASVTDTAKIYIPASMDAYNVAFKRKLVQCLLYCASSRERVWATVDYGTQRLFTGIVDLSNLSIESYAYQGALELTLKDNGYLLDEKIAKSVEMPVQLFPTFNDRTSPKTPGVYYKDADRENVFHSWSTETRNWYSKESFNDAESKYFHPDARVRVWNKGVVGGELAESVVGTLLAMAGYSVEGGTVDAEASCLSSSTLRCFTYDTSDDKTYRDVLDTLLKEYRMCLTFTPQGKARIVGLSHDKLEASRTIGYGLGGELGKEGGIKTSYTVSKQDGIKVTYSSELAVWQKQNVYTENLGSEFDENGELKGTEIKPEQCLPTTGDITATYQEYNASFLDRTYTTKISREQNKDLSIISTHGHQLEISQKNGTLEYPKLTVGESGEKGTGANPYFMPKKAQILLRNPHKMQSTDPESDAYAEEVAKYTINLQILNIVADVLYRNKTSTIYAPSAISNPESYESTYLFSDAEANTFANFYLGWKTYGAMKTDWTEYRSTADTLGSIIGYQHTDSAASSYCLLTEETLGFTGSADVPFTIKMHGVGIASYDGKALQKVSYTGTNKNSGKDGPAGPAGNGIKEVIVEYAVSWDFDKHPTEWSKDIPEARPLQYLWKRTTIKYTNPTISDTVSYVYYRQPENGSPGEAGPSPALLSIDTDTVYVNAYSDGPAKGFEGAEVNASVTVDGVKQEGWAFSVSGATKVAVSVDATLGKYTVTAIDDNARSGSFVVVASKDDKSLYAQVYVQKTYEIGSVLAEASGSTFGYYADNVPHNSTESIEVTVTLTGYSPGYAPRCTLGAEDVTLANGKFVIKASDVGERDYVTFSAIGIHNTSSITVRKVLDVASLSMSVDKTSFGYYADGTAHSGEGACTVTIVASGMSYPPTLKVAGKAKALTASAPKYTASVTNADLEASNAPTKVEATYGSLTRTATLVKVYDQPTITLVLSKDTFHYYADNVPHEEETGITASVSYRGLYEKPLLSVGGVQATLGEDNTCVIPPSAVEDKDSVAVEAYSAHIDTGLLLSTQYVFKAKDQPTITLVASATQFHQAGDGTVAPDEIVVTPKVSGLSQSAEIAYEFGGSAVTLTGGAYVVGKDAVDTYKTMTASWNGKLFDSLTILKTVDGKAMAYWYASVPEGREPGGQAFGSDGQVFGFGGQVFGPGLQWSDTVPDIAEGYVLWTKTVAPDGTVSIYRVQGPKGEPGEAGPQGPKGEPGESTGTYLGTGTRTTIPTKRPDGSDIVEGDFYLDISNTENPVPYEMRNGKWTAVDGSSAKWTVVASAVQGDVAIYCPNIDNSNSLYAFFRNLSAVNGFIDGLGTRKLTITNGGYIQSQSYADSNGLEGFYLPDDGNAVFETGLFRGGISNGWAIFGGLDYEITASTTQAQFFKALRNAGVGTGLYLSLGAYGAATWKTQYGLSFRTLALYRMKTFDVPILGEDIHLSKGTNGAKYCDIYALGETKFLVLAYVGSTYYAYTVDTSVLHDSTIYDYETALGHFKTLGDLAQYTSSSYCTDVSAKIPGSEYAHNLYMVHDGKLYLNGGKVLSSPTLAEAGTLSSTDGAVIFPVAGTKPCAVKSAGKSYMFMYIGGKLCFASSADGIAWKREFLIPSSEDGYRYYSPVLVGGVWYCLRASVVTSTGYVTMQFCKSSGTTAFTVIKEFDAVEWTSYADSEMNYVAYGGGKILFSVPSDKVLYTYDIATAKLSIDNTINSVPVYSSYAGYEQNISADTSGSSFVLNDSSNKSYQRIVIRNLSAVQGIWYDEAKERFIVLYATEDDHPIVRFMKPDTMESEYMMPTDTPAGRKPSPIESKNSLWFDGDKLAFGYHGSGYTYALPGKCNGNGIPGMDASDQFVYFRPYSPDAMSASLDLQGKKYKIHFFLQGQSYGEWSDFDGKIFKEITIDGTSTAPVPFTGKLCLRPSLSAPRGAVISGANIIMNSDS